jgi:hypothetical protein
MTNFTFNSFGVSSWSGFRVDLAISHIVLSGFFFRKKPLRVIRFGIK